MSDQDTETQEAQELNEGLDALHPDEPETEPADEPATDAEPVTDESEPTPEPEPEPEPEPQHGMSENQLEKRFKAAEKAALNYARRIGDIYEADADDLTDCPLCPSIHKGFVNVNDAGRVPDDVKNAAMMFLGYAREREYPASSQHHACVECTGLGKVATGSQVPGKETTQCPRCLGNGYVGPQGATPNGQVEAIMTGPLHTLEPTGAGVPDTDPSGEPRLLPDGRENPNYGKWPQYKIPVEPWGVTAGLNVQDAAA